MTTLRSLLAATDFSGYGRSAAGRAALLAAEQAASLTLLHVLSASSLGELRGQFHPPADTEARLVAGAERMLNELAAEFAAGTRLTAPAVRVRVGHVVDEILAAAAQADLLVLGARGWNPLRDALLGTTAERLLTKCPRPVLVTRREPQAAYRRVLVPVDFSRWSAAALRMALRVAPAADITVFHAYKVPYEGTLRLADVAEDKIREYRIAAQQRALSEIGRLIREAAGGDSTRCFSVVEHGDPAPLILDREAAIDADLIVIGKRGRSLIEETLLGSVTRHTLSDAKSDVLVVHAPPAAGAD